MGYRQCPSRAQKTSVAGGSKIIYKAILDGLKGSDKERDITRNLGQGRRFPPSLKEQVQWFGGPCNEVKVGGVPLKKEHTPCQIHISVWPASRQKQELDRGGREFRLVKGSPPMHEDLGSPIGAYVFSKRQHRSTCS